MNIKRYILIGLCVALALSFTCSAVDWDAYYYQNEDGTYGHDYESYKHDLALEMVEERGLNLDVSQYWTPKQDSPVLEYIFDFEAFQKDYDAMIAALPDEAPPIENGETAADPDAGSAVVEPDDEPFVEEIPMDEPVLDPEVIDDELLVNYDYSVDYVLNDLRSGVGDGSLLDAQGLKAVIRSIFGEYQPVTTTAVYTETVDGEVITSLVDVVAAGSAGVDWEYVSGVALFSMMLFCMFKLLGGIIS